MVKDKWEVTTESGFICGGFTLERKEEDLKMERKITIEELRAKGVSNWSVKDSSVRGYITKCTEEVKPGDKVIISNYFTLVTE